MKNRLYSVGLILAASVAFSPTVVAQELEEIVVTAQRRAQDMQDVPIMVSAFTRDAVRDLGWNDVTLVAHQTPNLQIKYSWGNSMPAYTIRGVGMNSFQASDQSSVALFIDDVFQTSMVSMGAHLYDIERVEVLKGPQGTLFGRNTNGGAVNYLTRAPSQESEGFMRVDYGSYDRIEVETAVGGAINDNWSARLSGFTVQQGEGWVHDRVSGKDVGEVNITAGRAQLLYEPSEDFSARFILFGSQDSSHPVYFQHIGTNAIGGGGSCQAMMEGRIDPFTCVDALGYSDTDGDPYAGDYTNAPNTHIDADMRLDNTNIGATVIIDKTFETFDLTSVSHWQSYDRWQPKESDGNPALFVDFLFASDVSAVSQEIRLTSTTESNFNWILGASIAKDSAEENPHRIGYLDDLGVRFGLTYKQERLNAAVFGQGIWELSDKLRLEVGGRFLYDDVDFYARTYIDVGGGGVNDEVVEFVVAGCPDPAGVIPLDCALDDTAFTGKIGLDYSVDDDTMIYGSIATGYKPGGFNGGLNTNSELYTPYQEETVTALELGIKTDLLDGRAQLNAAAFSYDYKGLQAATPRPAQNQAGVLNFLTNLAAADISGAEAEFRVLVTENIELNLGASILNTKNNDPGANFDGPWGQSERRLANAPKNSFNAALAWNVPNSDGSSWRFFTDYVYEGDHWKQIVNVKALMVNQSLWNARATWTSADEKWSLSAYGKNLSDTVYIMDDLGAGVALGWGVQVVGMPRTWGISARYEF
ncbi:MAG: hypothetical protein CMO98_07095 [Woeseia sp.]|nr:hypothetical protein [Woeseia sp.]